MHLRLQSIHVCRIDQITQRSITTGHTYIGHLSWLGQAETAVKRRSLDLSVQIQQYHSDRQCNWKWSEILVWISGLILIKILISISLLPKCGSTALSASVISPSFIKISPWMFVKWQEMPYSAMVKKMENNGKMNRNPCADPDLHQKSITSRGSPLAHVYCVWSTSISTIVSYPAYRRTDRQNEWSHYQTWQSTKSHIT